MLHKYGKVVGIMLGTKVFIKYMAAIISEYYYIIIPCVTTLGFVHQAPLLLHRMCPSHFIPSRTIPQCQKSPKQTTPIFSDSIEELTGLTT